jgi:hypothetical protein
MRLSRGVIGVVMLSCTVQFVLAVPGFAQSHNGYRAMVAVDHTAVGALRQYVPEPKAEILPVEIPWNLQLPRGYRELVESMLQRSPTFRRQCRRIANTRDLEVTLNATGGRSIAQIRAQTRIVREKDRLYATIEVLSLENIPELIAHELEHVIEQLDGIDLALRAAQSSGEVRTTVRDTFETTRAVRVGRTVAEEVKGAG